MDSSDDSELSDEVEVSDEDYNTIMALEGQLTANPNDYEKHVQVMRRFFEFRHKVKLFSFQQASRLRVEVHNLYNLLPYRSILPCCEKIGCWSAAALLVKQCTLYFRSRRPSGSTGWRKRSRRLLVAAPVLTSRRYLSWQCKTTSRSRYGPTSSGAGTVVNIYQYLMRKTSANESWSSKYLLCSTACFADHPEQYIFRSRKQQHYCCVLASQSSADQKSTL